MSQKRRDAQPGSTVDTPLPSPETRVCIAIGWTLVVVFLAFGLLLEAFHLVKLVDYFDVRLRRELWTLAHAHGALLGAITVLAGHSADRLVPSPSGRTAVARLVATGAILVPLGFLGGGIAPAEGDPSVAIVLVPIGALLALAGLALLARAAWRA